MACPFFLPLERIPEQDWPSPPRLPLGDPYRGECTANGASPHAPDAAALREFCNMGYAVRGCAHFENSGAVADAARLTVVADEPGLVRIAFARERNHLPHDLGVFECGQDGSAVAAGPDEPVLRSQALAYLRSYLRRKK